jgi:hypothetical protein
MRDNLPSDGSNAPREVGTSAQPPTLSSRIASLRAKAEAAKESARWEWPDDGWDEVYGPGVMVGWDVVAATNSFAPLRLAEAYAAHIAANDPATVLALLDVVEAAEAHITCRPSIRESCEQTACGAYGICAALDRLKEVLR